jgi:hypothetical protein
MFYVCLEFHWATVLEIINVVRTSLIKGYDSDFVRSEFVSTLGHDEFNRLLAAFDRENPHDWDGKLLLHERGERFEPGLDGAWTIVLEQGDTKDSMRIVYDPAFDTCELRWELGDFDFAEDMYVLLRLAVVLGPSINVSYPLINVGHKHENNSGSFSEYVDLTVSDVEVERDFLPLALSTATLLSQFYQGALMISSPSVPTYVRPSQRAS